MNFAKSTECNMRFKKGHKGYWFGKKRGPISESQRQKVSKKLKGRIISPETRLKISIANKGKQNSLGMKHSNETKRKIGLSNSISLKGRIVPEEARKNISLGKRGKYMGQLASGWKGGITPKNHLLRMSWQYKDWREKVFTRDNYTCQICFIRGGILNADHIKKFANYPELRFDVNNGRTLCISCHKKTDNFGNKSSKEFKKVYGV